MGLHFNDTAEARFWPKVDKSAGPWSCWPWTARLDDDGYGRFRPDGANTGDVGAHRVAYVLNGGALADGEIVCHHCDNPPCCNPDHLFAGTWADNMHDRDQKGRHARMGPRNPATGLRNGAYTKPESRRRGELNGQSRWTVADIRAMRAAFAAGESQGSIARRLGTGQAAVSAIVRRKAWAHVD